MSYTPKSLFENQISLNPKKERDIIDFFDVDSATYSKTYLFLKAQRTILERMNSALQNAIPESSSGDQRILDGVVPFVDAILNSDFGTVFQVASNAIPVIRSALSESNNHAVEKILSSTLSCCVALTKIFSIVSCSIREAEPPEAWKEEDTVTPRIHRPSGDTMNKNDVVLVLCRICEEYVPIDLIESHSKNCMIAYQSEYTIFSTDEKIRKLQEAIQTSYLNIAWPGPPNLAVTFRLPLLHVVMLLDRAAAAETDGSANDILDSVLSSLHHIHFDAENSNVLPLMGKAAELVEEKLNACSSFTEANNELMVINRHSGGIPKIRSPSPIPGLPNSGPATTIANFEFLKPISSGAFARVFLARKKKTGDIYAIKVTPKSSVRQKNEIRHALAEKNILLSATNPFIVNFYYSFIGEHNLYLVMEFLPGGDLYSLLQHVGSLDERSAKVYTCQIAIALQYLHSRGIVHRDIKPDNMLITASGRLKLTDFGLSLYGAVDRSVPNNSLDQSISQNTSQSTSQSIFQSTSQSIFQSTSQSISQNTFQNIQEKNSPIPEIHEEKVGTPDYVAPEIVLAQPHGAAVDFWSLGAVVFELLTGVPPFHGETEEETFANIVKGRADWGLLDEYGCSSEAKSLLHGLLQAEPSKRFGFAQVVSHPWFSDIDWNHLESLEPPFVPEVGANPDTEYFEARSPLVTGVDNDIADDIAQAVKMSSPNVQHTRMGSAVNMAKMPYMGMRNSRSFNTGTGGVQSIDESDLVDDLEDMSLFPSVSLAQLAQSTKEAAKRVRHRRSSSTDELEGLALSMTASDDINLPISGSFGVPVAQKEESKLRRNKSSFFRRDRAKSIMKKVKPGVHLP